MAQIILNDGAATFACAPDDTLLRAGLRAGLGMSYECNTGSCGTCKVELQAGEVTNLRPDATAITDRDRSKNRILACQSVPLGDCKISGRLRDEFVPPVPPARTTLTLTATRDLTHDIREFVFKAPAATPAGFRPGQYAMLTLPGLVAARAYSMSNITDGGNEWHFQIKRVPDGKGTTALFDQVKIGDSIAMDAPFGRAYLQPTSPRDIICIAGGSGLSPMVSIARGMVREAKLAGRQLHFFFGGRGPADICGEDLLRALPGYGERIHFHPVISMPELDTEKQWQGETGFVHDLVLKQFAGRLPHFEFYYAGPPPMTQAVQRMLVQNKVPFGQMHYDSFY